MNVEMYEVKIEVSGICIKLILSDFNLFTRIKKNFSSFLSNKKPVLSIDVEIKSKLKNPSHKDFLSLNKIVLAEDNFSGYVNFDRKIGWLKLKQENHTEASEFCVMCNVKCIKKHDTSHIKHYTKIEGLGDLSPNYLKHWNFKDSSLADKFRMLLLTQFSENKQKNHKSSPRRGEDLEKGYHYEGLGDLSPNYIDSLISFLRNLYSVLIVKNGGLLLHACGIVKFKKAYIFFGSSGSGKTTVAELSKGCKIISDDLVGIKYTGSSYKVFAIPIQKCQYKNSKNYPIIGLFKLVKDKKVYLKKLSITQALADILTTLNFSDNGITKELLNRYYELLMKVPCYELHFKKNNKFWRCINDEYIGKMSEEI